MKKLFVYKENFAIEGYDKVYNNDPFYGDYFEYDEVITKGECLEFDETHEVAVTEFIKLEDEHNSFLGAFVFFKEGEPCVCGFAKNEDFYDKNLYQYALNVRDFYNHKVEDCDYELLENIASRITSTSKGSYVLNKLL